MDAPPKKKVVLIAEDDPHDRPLLHYAIAAVNPCFEAHFVVDGVEALDYLYGREKFEDRKRCPFPDILVLDIVMPRMTGIEVLSELANSQLERDLQIFVLTGSEDPKVAASATEAKAKFMRKPMEIDVWIEFVRGLNFMLA